jgi:RNA polymerase sigma factor for flagellar operon FliA
MLPLVKRVALKIRKRLPAHMELDDLFSDGLLGLVDALTKFDASKRVRLETYASHRIRGSILDGLRGADPASRDLRRKNQRIQKLYHELEVKLGRSVTDEEMAATQGMKLAQWHRELNEIQSAGLDCGTRALSAGPNAIQRSVEPEFLAGDEPDPFDLCYRNEQREILARALSRLQERQRQIVELYHQQGLTMRQVAELLSVDESRISQLHAAALVELKAYVDSLLRPGQAGTSEAGALSSRALGPNPSSSVRPADVNVPHVLAKGRACRLPRFFRGSTFVRTKSITKTKWGSAPAIGKLSSSPTRYTRRSNSVQPNAD